MDTSTGSTFGDLLRRYRNAANITQESLAERTGLTPQAISLLERGERRRPHGDRQDRGRDGFSDVCQ